MNMATAFRVLRSEFPTKSVLVQPNCWAREYEENVETTFTVCVHGIAEASHNCVMASDADLENAVRNLLADPLVSKYRTFASQPKVGVKELQRDLNHVAEPAVLAVQPF